VKRASCPTSQLIG